MITDVDIVVCLSDCILRGSKENVVSFSQYRKLLLLNHVKNEPTVLDKMQAFLIYLVEEFGKISADEWQIVPFFLSQNKIANLLVTTRVTTTRILSKLEKEGRIKRSGKKIYIRSGLLFNYKKPARTQ